MTVHPFGPVFDTRSSVLILGSFPSVKSRENRFFYGHPQNRFWRVIAAVTESGVPAGISEKKALLLSNRLALWDVLASCEISGSSDSSIRSAVPNDLRCIFRTAPIRKIFTNGAKADELYRKYLFPVTGIEAVRLPSTSPANAARSLPDLIKAWRAVLPEPETFRDRVYAAVRTIPAGKAATYGQIAAAIGCPGGARAVGNALHFNPDPDFTPCFRVVDSAGRAAANFGFGGAEEQLRRLRADGVSFCPDGRVNLSVSGIPNLVFHSGTEE